MLQPLQLKEVSVRYAGAIGELRDFLEKAGSVVGTAESLGGIAARLQCDRAFRRDLTSHIWVVMHQGDRQMSYSDLLGVLAVAAAGTQFAPAANEDDAHYLLRFLMEAGRSLDTVAQPRIALPLRRAAEPASNFSTEPPSLAGGDGREILNEPLLPSRAKFPSLEVPPNTRGERRRFALVTAAACVMAALLAGLWGHHRPAADAVEAVDKGSTSRSIAREAEQSGAADVLAEVDGPQSNLRGSQATTMHSALLTAARKSLRRTPPKPAVRSARAVSATVPSSSARRVAAPLQTTRAATQGSTSTPVIAAIQHGAHGAHPAASASDFPTPSKRSSQREANLLANAEPRDVPARPVTSRMGSANLTRGGIVRPTSLGIMAGNVMYSPVPAYPAAASAAQVQGEVKIEAEVDRAGNVASARVISGPPQLQEAALDAVERWRYRPYLSFGKPISTVAMTIIDFQLP